MALRCQNGKPAASKRRRLNRNERYGRRGVAPSQRGHSHRKICCAAELLPYHLWASPDCVLADASGKFFAQT